MAAAARRRATTVELAWAPQPGPQAAFVNCPLNDVVYGGARGGGKTDAALGDWAIHAERYGAEAKGLMIRRTRKALESTIARAKRIFRGMAQWKESKSGFVWRNGAVLVMNYLERDDDADQYQGHDYTRVYVEELTQFASPAPIDKLRATLRSGTGVPTGFRGTCNPGGAGHSWVKERYIDHGPWVVTKHTFQCPFTGRQIETRRVFIPAKLSDNPQLLENDPTYVAQLYQSGSPQLVRAWLEGDWDIIEGAFFPEWSAAKHVLQPFTIPNHWARIRGFDWGSAKPFSVGWWAVASDSYEHPQGLIPRGALVRYREWYGASAPNVGLKLTAEQVADGIKERQVAGESIALSVADPAIFAENGGPSIAERMGQRGVHWTPGDNKRVAQVGAVGGWDQVRGRLVGIDGRPMLYSFSTCTALNRTLPALQHDDLRPEDVDSDGEDHAPDETRYVCMSRPWTAPSPTKPKKRDMWDDAPGEEVNWRTA